MVVQRLLATGGELLTLVTGADAPADLADDAGRPRTPQRPAPSTSRWSTAASRRYLLLVGLE